ncbi:MAG: peptide deformylase [Bacteroidales bacterium]
MIKFRSALILTLLTAVIIVNGCGVATVGTGHIGPKNSFSAQEIKLISDRDSTTPFRVLKTDNKSDSLFLRGKSSGVDPIADKQILDLLSKRMYKTVTDSASLGVGIAAPQIGISKNVILVQRFDKEGSPFELYLNPEIIQFSKMKQDCREGCLSVPDKRGVTKSRSYAILIKYQRSDNSFVTEMVEGFTAVIFQHETDHLKGALFFDYL